MAEELQQLLEKIQHDGVEKANAEAAAILAKAKAEAAAILKDALKVNPIKCAFFLPLPITQLIQEGKATFKVLSSPDRWFGVTYAADKPTVVAALKTMTEEGKYPDGLWK